MEKQLMADMPCNVSRMFFYQLTLRGLKIMKTLHLTLRGWERIRELASLVPHFLYHPPKEIAHDVTCVFQSE